MKVSQISQTNFGITKILNRGLLQKTSKLNPLNGPYEIKEAKKLVKIYAAGNAAEAACLAQIPGGDELVLSGIEAVMAAAIINGIYNFKASSGFISSMLTAYMGNKVGTTAFRFASKAVTWVPGIGNAINAGVAGATTYALGEFIINRCEQIDKARKRGEEIDKILKGL